MTEPLDRINFEKVSRWVDRLNRSIWPFKSFSDFWNASRDETGRFYYARAGYPMGKSERGFKKWRKRR